MRIGDFAKECGISVSTLRYYDSQGLLSPVYTDIFTGYRYYDKAQIEVCIAIGNLKTAGFTLSEIKQILYSNDPCETKRLFEKKRLELHKKSAVLMKYKHLYRRLILCSKEILHRLKKTSSFLLKTTRKS